MTAFDPAMPEGDFAKRRRSILLGLPDYVEQIADVLDTFDVVTDEMLQQRASAPDCTRAALFASSSARAWDGVRYMHLQYSAGIAVSRLGAQFPRVVHFWEIYARLHEVFHDSAEGSAGRAPHLYLADRDFWKAIRLASFALLLGHSELLPQIAALWDYENEEKDGLLERLVAPFVPGRAAPPDTCTRHLPYFKLLKVFAADPAKRPALMAKYMDEWYTASRREPYYESHTKGREHSFLGYWSFEAAAVAYVLDIDDASFRGHEFYPKDLADYARGLPRPAAIGGLPASDDPAPDRLRCLAGQACPREGMWFTPARPDSRRRFAQGETMPEVGGSFGATIWQWDLGS